jgi:hypothetical protein
MSRSTAWPLTGHPLGARTGLHPTTLALPEGGLDEIDPLAQMALAEAADRGLLRLVVCAACATLMLALASSLL